MSLNFHTLRNKFFYDLNSTDLFEAIRGINFDPQGHGMNKLKIAFQLLEDYSLNQLDGEVEVDNFINERHEFYDLNRAFEDRADALMRPDNHQLKSINDTLLRTANTIEAVVKEKFGPSLSHSGTSQQELNRLVLRLAWEYNRIAMLTKQRHEAGLSPLSRVNGTFDLGPIPPELMTGPERMRALASARDVQAEQQPAIRPKIQHNLAPNPLNHFTPIGRPIRQPRPVRPKLPQPIQEAAPLAPPANITFSPRPIRPLRPPHSI